MVVAKGGAKLKPGQSTGNLVCDRSITDDNMYQSPVPWPDDG